MNEQIKTYFENLRKNAENNANKLRRGTLEAYWTYEFNLNHNSSEFECNELPWTTDMSDFVKTMREAGIETIAVTETSTALLENLHKLANQGCTIEEFAKKQGEEHGGDKVQHADLGDAQHIQADSQNEQGADRADLRQDILTQQRRPQPWQRQFCHL